MGELIAAGGEGPASIPGIVFREGKEGIARFSGSRFPGPGDRAGTPSPSRRTGNSTDSPTRTAFHLQLPAGAEHELHLQSGCPYTCSDRDCSVFRRSFRYNSAEYLYEHLRYLKERFGIRHVTFYDDQFTFHRSRVEAFAGMMIDRPLGMTFNCAVRAEHVDPELLRRLKAAGCWMVSLGIETGDGRLLAEHRQHADLERIAGRSG